MADINKLEMWTGTCLYSQSLENEARDLLKVQRQPGLHHEYQMVQGYTGRICHQTNNIHNGETCGLLQWLICLYNLSIINNYIKLTMHTLNHSPHTKCIFKGLIAFILAVSWYPPANP